MPRAALAYLQFGDEAAVLHKKPVSDSRGRSGSTLAHALTGPASVLSARVALGLHGWAGWIQQEPASSGGPDGPGLLDPLDARDLRETAEAGYRKLSESARQLDPDLLAALFATLLSDPLGRFSFSPADAGEAGTGPLADPDDLEAKLLCAVLDTIGDATGQAWTFSTCEAEEPASAARPRLVFLSQAQGFSTRVPTGHRAPVGQLAWFGQEADVPEADVLQRFAGTLAETFTVNPDVLGLLQPRVPVTSAHEAIAWARDAEFAPGVPADFGNVLLAIGQGRAEPRFLDRLPSRPEVLEAGVRALTGEMLGRLGALWRPGTEAATNCPGAAAALQRQAAWRFANDAPTMTAATIAEFGVPLSVWLDQLARLRSESGVTGLTEPVKRVAALGVPGLAAGLAAGLAGGPPHELLALADECAVRLPDLSAQLLGAVAGRDRMSSWDRSACRSQLELRMFMVGAVERCFPNDPAGACEVLRQLLTVVVIPEVRDREDVDALLAQVTPVRSAPLMRALAESLPPGPRRVLVQAAAGNIWFADNGLAPLPVEMPRPAERPAAPAAPAAPAGPADPPDGSGGPPTVPSVPVRNARAEPPQDRPPQDQPPPDQAPQDQAPQDQAPPDKPRRLSWADWFFRTGTVAMIAALLACLPAGGQR